MIRVYVYSCNRRLCAHRVIQDKDWIWYIAKPFFVADSDHQSLAVALNELSGAELTEIANKNTAKTLVNEVAKALGLNAHTALYKSASLFCFDIKNDSVSLTLHKPAPGFQGYEDGEQIKFLTLDAAVAATPI